MHDLVFLSAAGFAGGAMNAAGGGGSFVTLPALLASGVPSVVANASSTVALFPGAVASTWACREELPTPEEVALWPLLGVTTAGGLAGAGLLLATPSAAFRSALPWLLLVATLTFAVGPRAGAALRRRVEIRTAPLVAAQFLLGVYGGYFGGAVGIMMLAVWGLVGAADVRTINPLKTLMVAAANATAVAFFVVADQVAWSPSLPLLVAACAGGYLGARGAQRVAARTIRVGILAVAVAMTVVLFVTSG